MAAAQPVAASSRLALLDAIRGVALCGILFVNIIDMGGPIAMDRPLAPPSVADPDWQIWSVMHLFLTGTMRGLFSLLFGVGLLLFLGEDPGTDRLRALLRRLVLLLLFGIANATLLLWPGDILVTYALAGALAVLCHRFQANALFGLVLVTMLLLSIWGALQAPGIRAADMVYSAPMLAREMAARLGSYGDTLAYMSRVSWVWANSGFLCVWMGDALLFMVLGMALYRSGWFDPDGGVEGVTGRLLAIGYGGGLSLRMLQLALVWPEGGAPTTLSAFVDQPARLLLTVGHLTLLRWLWRGGCQSATAQVLGLMGRMPLTLYLAQSAIGAVIFSGFGLGYWNSLSWPQLWGVALLILLAQALFARLWFALFAYGPLEWGWRWGTYGARPQLR